ncbi:helix-turn-helix domain-containing protein [Seohaeicola saemankumensis]|nr:AraC family transcriptional regulator [Seohaeicola saemankumensis]MCA0871226.1 helix-turn-helix domain-containing protein [Seohaeicola saemankumensis]
MFTHRAADQNVRLRDYYDRYPIIEAEAVQLGRGALIQRSVTIWGRNCILVRSAIWQKTTSTIVAHPDWVMLQCPISWQGDLKINGHVVRAGDVLLLDGGKEWITSGERRDQILLGVKRKALSAAITSQTAGEITKLELENRLLVNGSAVGAVLRRTLISLLATVDGMAEDNGRLSMPPVHEADLVSAIAACLDTSMDTAKPLEHQCSSVRTVAAVRSALREAGPISPSVADLCKLAGVGRTQMHKCFKEVYGISTGQYIKKHRLTLAREALLDPLGAPKMVKQAALMMGFLGSGRFAHDYKAMFGELPSTTLARANTCRASCS